MSTNTLYNQQIFATYFTPGPQPGIGIDPQEILRGEVVGSLVFVVIAMAVAVFLHGFFRWCVTSTDLGEKDDPESRAFPALVGLIGLAIALIIASSNFCTLCKACVAPNVVIYEATKSLTK